MVKQILNLSINAQSEFVLQRVGIASTKVGFDWPGELEGSARERKVIVSVSEQIKSNVHAARDLLDREKGKRISWLHESAEKPWDGSRDAIHCIGVGVGCIDIESTMWLRTHSKLSPACHAAPGVNVTAKTSERIGCRVDATCEIENNHFLQPRVEIGATELDTIV